MPLTEIAIRAAKPGPKPIKLSTVIRSNDALAASSISGASQLATIAEPSTSTASFTSLLP